MVGISNSFDTDILGVDFFLNSPVLVVSDPVLRSMVLVTILVSPHIRESINSLDVVFVINLVPNPLASVIDYMEYFSRVLICNQDVFYYIYLIRLVLYKVFI